MSSEEEYAKKYDANEKMCETALNTKFGIGYTILNELRKKYILENKININTEDNDCKIDKYTETIDKSFKELDKELYDISEKLKNPETIKKINEIQEKTDEEKESKYLNEVRDEIKKYITEMKKVDVDPEKYVANIQELSKSINSKLGIDDETESELTDSHDGSSNGSPNGSENIESLTDSPNGSENIESLTDSPNGSENDGSSNGSPNGSENNGSSNGSPNGSENNGLKGLKKYSYRRRSSVKQKLFKPVLKENGQLVGFIDPLKSKKNQNKSKKGGKKSNKRQHKSKKNQNKSKKRR
jgi:hypothetical protein